MAIPYFGSNEEDFRDFPPDEQVGPEPPLAPQSPYGDPPPKPGDKRLRPDGTWETWNGSGWVVDTTPPPTNTPAPGVNPGLTSGDRRPSPRGPEYFEQWNGSEWITYDTPGQGMGVLDGNYSGGGGEGGDGEGGGGGGNYTSAGPFRGLELPEYVDTYGDYAPEVWDEPDPFTYAEWVPPDPSRIHDDPSYQWRFNEGMRPIQNARAMAGLGPGGASMKALTKYGQGFASNEFDRIYQRAADTYDRGYGVARDTHQSNRDNAFSGFTLNEGNRRDAFWSNKDASRGAWTLNNGRLKDIWNADWDAYKFQNDDAYRYWNSAGTWASNGSRPVDP